MLRRKNPSAAQNQDDAPADPGEAADVDARIEQLVEGEIPIVDGDDIDIVTDVIAAEDADADFIEGEIVDNGRTVSTDKELVVINSSVADKDAITAELKPNQDVLILEAKNGLAELNEYLDSSDTKYSAIHFVTHGNDGYISVNGAIIDAENFDAAPWQEIGEHLTDDGDILLYGCDTAANAEGKALVELIAEASGADVAASTDATGISGDWELEYASGYVDHMSISIDGADFNLTNINVTSNADSGAGTLRQALADAVDGDEITFTLGTNNTITLSSTLTIETSRFSSAGLTIDGSNTDGDNVILDGNNAIRVLTYNISYIGADLTITAKDITVTADAQKKTYGDADAVLTYQVTGLVGNDVLSGNLERAAGENVGTYAIGLGTLSNSNYNISYIGADLTITAKDITVMADAQSKVYGESDPALTYQVTGLVAGDSLSGELTRTAGENVGSYAITQGTLANSNYNITYVGADLIIAAKDISVIADSVSKVYGESDPALTYKVTGLVGTDVLSGSLERESGENVGTYAITQGTLANSNYSINFTAGKFTIEAPAYEYHDYSDGAPDFWMQKINTGRSKNVEALPVSGVNIRMDFAVREMTIDDIAVDLNDSVAYGVSNVDAFVTGQEICVEHSAGDEQEFSFRTSVKLHCAIFDCTELPEEYQVYAGDLAEKAPALKSEFEKILDKMMVLA